MLWSNFILGFKLCFPLFQTHYHTDYHTQKQRKIKTETKDKIELQICIQLSKLVQALQILLMSGVTVTSASQVLECNFGVKYTKFGVFANPAPPLFFHR